MKHAGQQFCVGLAAVLLVGCASVKYTADYDTKADFSSLKSFDWQPLPAGHKSDPRVNYGLLEPRVKAAVEAELTRRGYQKVATGSDFRIGWYATVDPKVDVATIDRYYGYPGYAGWPSHYTWVYLPTVTQTYVRQYEEGTLVLDIVNAKSNQCIWRGSAQAEIHRNLKPEEREKRLQEAIGKILAQFPPRKK